jgi:hypothetical protein
MASAPQSIQFPSPMQDRFPERDIPDDLFDYSKSESDGTEWQDFPSSHAGVLR